jgi:hypothetical protein
VNLAGLVHTHPGTDIAGQLIGAATMPLAREKTVLKASQQICLEVVASITTKPSPTW